MFGQIELNDFEACKLTQEAATAWGALDGIVGASYEPILYLGKQQVKGTNHFFLALQTLTTLPVIRRVVTLAINQYGGKSELIPESIRPVL